MTRTLLVVGDKEYKITIPDDCKITFGPFAPPSGKESGYGQSAKASGTLRIYQGTKENIIGCFSPVSSFRDITSITYSEKVAVEEGASLWKNDVNGYEREERVKSRSEWRDEQLPAVTMTARKKKK